MMLTYLSFTISINNIDRSIENNLISLISLINNRTNNGVDRTSETCDANAIYNCETVEQPKILLLHDSLCKGINETILSREKITTEKIWAPTIDEMINKIESYEGNVDLIILQALTRDLGKLSLTDMGNQLKRAIETASSKAKKVMVPTIVQREDDEKLNKMAAVINANIRYTYLDDPTVVM